LQSNTAEKEAEMTTIERVRRTAVGAERWEPCVTSDGRSIGEAEWLRRRTDENWSHTAMLWRCEPMSFEYEFPGDESFLIISGSVRIELTGESETVELQGGDVASFPKGTRSVWTVIEPLEKFTVVSG
jgi:uncharacterized cupin superfamily protein